MRRGLRVPIVIGALLTITIGAAVVVSRRTSPAEIAAAAGSPRVTVDDASDLPVLAAGPAPSIEGGAGWLNTPPLRDADLAGKVVLYDFWTFGCINCAHTLPHVRAWQQRYAPDGLVIVSIHSPEFEYEADPANVADYVRDEGIAYPVVLDPDMRVWRTWHNHYWPAFYLHDTSGARRLVHFGEGAYDETEDAIRALLGVDPASPRAVVDT